MATTATTTTSSSTTRMIRSTPHEGSPHTCTWMSYGASIEIYETKRLLRAIKENLRTIAISIVVGSTKMINSSSASSQQQFKNCKEIVNVLVRQSEYSTAQEEFQQDIDTTNREKNMNIVLNQDIVLIPITNLNDIWIRDFGPTFVHWYNQNDDNEVPLRRLGGIDSNFNGWGRKQKHDHDTKVAKFVIDYINRQQSSNPTSQVACTYMNDPRICFEGGGIEFDGYGTAIIIESCFLVKNRNPNLTKEQCTTILCNLFGLTKIIWLPGIYDKYDITGGHVDGYIRIVHPTLIVMAYDDSRYSKKIQDQHISILQNATNARNEKYRIVFVPNPKIGKMKSFFNPEYCASYVNYYLCNQTVLVPQFSIDPDADRTALRIFQTDLFAQYYNIVPINIHNGIATCGGGIHCVTQQQPSLLLQL